ncbi:MAG: hypothetical protein JF609_07070 [Verrucomicrobia bacterium]|nr:hypothetical protein [Verrucomicrobiota bacterium]
MENDPNSLPKNLTLDEYAVAVAQIDIDETSQERVTSAIQGFLVRSYLALVMDDDGRYENYNRIASGVYRNYNKKTAFSTNDRIALPPMSDLKKVVVTDLLNPQGGLPYEARAILRTKLGLPAESTAPAATNAVPKVPVNIAPTNAPAPAVP